MDSAARQMFPRRPLSVGGSSRDWRDDALKNAKVVSVAAVIHYRSKRVIPRVHIGAAINRISAGKSGDNVRLAAIQGGTLRDVQYAGEVGRAVDLAHSA